MTIHQLRPQRQQRGEIERHIERHDGNIWIVTTTPDGVRTTDILTPEEALQWSDELRDAAADELARGGPDTRPAPSFRSRPWNERLT